MFGFYLQSHLLGRDFANLCNTPKQCLPSLDVSVEEVFFFFLLFFIFFKIIFLFLSDFDVTSRKSYLLVLKIFLKSCHPPRGIEKLSSGKGNFRESVKMTISSG